SRPFWLVRRGAAVLPLLLCCQGGNGVRHAVRRTGRGVRPRCSSSTLPGPAPYPNTRPATFPLACARRGVASLPPFEKSGGRAGPGGACWQGGTLSRHGNQGKEAIPR